MSSHDYPRPTMVRSSYLSLDGIWKYEEGFSDRLSYPENGKDILVPFSPETVKSGIHHFVESKAMTYGKKFIYQKKRGKRVLLHFDGVDYQASVYLNGKFLSAHTGGYDRFTLDISDTLRNGENELVLFVYDDDSRYQVRGKQRWENHVYGCFYLPTSGIWKSVWIEEVSATYFDSVSIRTNERKADFSFLIGGRLEEGMTLVLSLIDREGKEVYTKAYPVAASLEHYHVTMKDPHLWSIENPYLYDVEVSLSKEGKILDQISTYCGFRKVEAKGDRIYLNGKEIFLKMVLDQGYFPDSGLTPSSYEELENDVKLIKAMGFNGVRMHQKIEDERFYTLCDKYGLLCTLEMPSMYTYSKEGAIAFEKQWISILKEHDHHPSLIACIPFNETWGLDDREFIHRKENIEFVNHIVSLTKAFDKTRFVISNDGWEHTRSDLLTLHIYEQDAKVFFDSFALKNATEGSPLCDRLPYVKGYHYHGEPILFTEFGGASFKKDLKEDAWGYGTAVIDEEGFLVRLKSLVDMLASLPYCRGYCYTQLTNVEQEVNGLLTIDRKPKASIEKIRDIIENGGK